ncbi:sorbosone dehydrogenase family protein [Novosphingobium sp. AP12]|uniref:PQQ-dependent sugar dehydrogenase n=1 Tax=Novosphingobium sp. AP12 TaxID=1144305 RepID=UPI000271E226|nr:sorbosone dehydrogenase family protein [Novosphingobium sp. AP12]EJL33411.1 glucose/sorbosone dehydrogenase [Novosphingobium sp. AP12]
MKASLTRTLPVALLTCLAGCGKPSENPITVTEGPNPTLVPEQHAAVPAINIAELVGWDEGQAPTPAAGLAVKRFATGLEHPRWLLALPNGDVLVAESNTPADATEDYTGVKGKVTKHFLSKGNGGQPSPNKIMLLRDINSDGIADLTTVFIDRLHSPFGMALVGSTLYIANTDAIVAVPWKPGDTKASAPPQQIVELPAGKINHHWTKNVIASPDGSKLYVTVGSNSNVGDKGIAAEEGRAAIYEVDPRAKTKRLFASGIRNPNGMGWSSDGKLWVTANERDELGPDLVPDYMTSVKDGGFYGFPWIYWGDHRDKRVKDPQPPAAARTIRPDYALGAHTASLGLTFSNGQKLGPKYAEGVFIGQHGSWNREPASGYRVVFIPFADGKPTGALPQDVLTGFLAPDGKHAFGRPVGVTFDLTGALLVADDAGGSVWRVTSAGRQPTRPSGAPVH